MTEYDLIKVEQLSADLSTEPGTAVDRIPSGSEILHTQSVGIGGLVIWYRVPEEDAS